MVAYRFKASKSWIFHTETSCRLEARVLVPFAVWPAFPTADYYGTSVAVGVTTGRRSLSSVARLGLPVEPPSARWPPHWGFVSQEVRNLWHAEAAVRDSRFQQLSWSAVAGRVGLGLEQYGPAHGQPS